MKRILTQYQIFNDRSILCPFAGEISQKQSPIRNEQPEWICVFSHFKVTTTYSKCACTFRAPLNVFKFQSMYNFLN